MEKSGGLSGQMEHAIVWAMFVSFVLGIGAGFVALFYWACALIDIRRAGGSKVAPWLGPFAFLWPGSLSTAGQRYLLRTFVWFGMTALLIAPTLLFHLVH